MTSKNLQNLNNSEKPFSFWNGPYQYIRTIRFRSNPPIQHSKCFKEKLNKSNSTDENFKLSQISEELNRIKENLENIFYVKTSKKNQKEKNNSKNMGQNEDHCNFNADISIKLAWLRKYHKDIFYLLIKKTNNETSNSYTKKGNKHKRWNLKKDLKDIHNDFKEKFDLLKEVLKKIETASKISKEKQRRHSDISYSIKQLKVTLPYFIDFLEESHTSKPDFDRQINETIEMYKKLQMEIAEQYYLSNEGSGVEIAKASFNYYTVNKKPKDYMQEIEEIKKQLNKQPCTYLCENTKGNIEWNRKNSNNKHNKDADKQNQTFTFQSGLEKEWIKRYYFKNIKYHDQNKDLKEGFSISLNQTHSMMKAFKAEQKSIFYEIMNHIAENKKNTYKVNNKNHLLYGHEISFEEFNHIDKLNKLFSLFQFKDNWNKYHNKKHNCNNKEQWYTSFINFSKQLSHIKDDSKKSQRIAQERGEFLKSYFTKYVKFCNAYEAIAQEKGQLTSQLKNVEKEKLESSQINYWSFIYVENNHKQLWLVPKDSIQDAKKFVYNNHGRQNYVKEDTKYLCCFESLTMRALNKLCFSEQKSTFVQDMPSELQNLQKDVKEFKTEGNKEKIEEKNKKKLQFLKKLLKSEYFDINKEPKDKGLDITNFNLDWIDSVKSLEEFEKHLEQSCYFVKTIKLSSDEKNKFLKDYQVTVLDITSYDLEGRNKKYNPVSPNRVHTNLWNAFLENTKFNHKSEIVEKNMKKSLHNSIRLNPEVKIYYRKSDDKIRDYFNNKRFPEKFKHRKKQSQITLAFTLNLNAEGKHEELAFSKPEEIREKIDGFNKKLNEQLNFETAWKYGIDRGEIELATLCISRINQSDNKPEFAKFECFTFKDYTYSGEYPTKTGQNKIGEAIRNLSNFIDKENLFQKHQTSCLDLTTAKVIKGKLISNGDLMTYLKLKKESAKRRLYDLYSERKMSKGTRLSWSNNVDGDKNKHSSDGVLNIRLNDKTEKTIYHYYNKYEDILSQQDIENSLNSYLKALLDSGHSKHTPSIEQINHLRSAITANMVGVICHLQKSYPGFIILEDLPKSHKLFNIDENIARKLENAPLQQISVWRLSSSSYQECYSIKRRFEKKTREK